MTREGEVEGIDDYRIREDGGVHIILCSVQVIFSRESISRPHLRPWGDLPNDVKILEKEGPVGLATRKFLRILEIGQVLMVGENENRM